MVTLDYGLSMKQTLLETSDQLREFLFAVIESLPGGILLVDKKGELLAVNSKASSLLGIAGCSVQNRSCWQLLTQKLGVSGVDQAQLHVSGGRFLGEVQEGDSGQDKRYILISRNDLQSPFVGISGFFLSLEDITFPALVEAQKNRHDRFAAMQEMAAAMSQELKNPLGSLELYASILKRELYDDPDNERVTTQMLGAVRTMTHLIDNFTTFAALPPPEIDTVDIDGVLLKCLGILREIGSEHDIFFQSRFAHQGVTLPGDAQLLEQLFLNLGMNAVESMKQGGEVLFATRLVRPVKEHGSFLEVRVEDQGEGILPENIAKIFDPFFTTRDRKRGVGLAICHYIAESHNGLIEVESNKGSGAIFRVLLPVMV